MKRSGAILALGGVAIMLLSGNAAGWDSETRDRTRTFPSASYGITDDTRYLRPNERSVSVSFLQDGIGSPGALYPDSDPANTRLLSCPNGFVQPSDAAFRDIGSCAISGRLGDARWAWAQIRKQGDSPRTSEHASIAKVAANRAGLLDTTLFDPFWVSYASQNTYVASPLDLDASTGLTKPDARYIVGQSYLPTGGLPGSAHANRSISLLEVAQFPDFVNSLADWATGAELCPLAGVAGAYEGPLNDACHEFKLAMGATNVTHFKPLNRAMWRYYHKLALERMHDCGPLDDTVGPSYDDNNLIQYGDGYTPTSRYATEAHECAHEAMMYEMFGQHFLQDAWSTGHMWRRWGYPSLIDFPDHLSGEDASEIPPENLGPRRAGIAGLVAAVSGMVHGSKGIVQSELRALYGGLFAGLADGRLVDDPLCGPTYRDLGSFGATKSVEWSTGGARYAGGGDLFWWPEQSVSGTIFESDAFEEQRNRMLNCSAKSMLEVYDLGPDVFGAPTITNFTSAIEDIANVDSEYCFGQFATNESMLAAVGIFDAAYLNSIPQRMLVTNLFPNKIVNGVLGGGVDFPTRDIEEYAEGTRIWTLAKDRDRFKEKLADRFQMDFGRVREVYAKYADDPTGTEAASNPVWRDKDGVERELTVFGVPGATEPPMSADPPSFGVRYTDYLVKPTTGTTGQMERAMSQVFWRGNLQRTCLESTANDASVLQSLRSACLGGATGTGNLDACTECTWRAEALVPPCGSPINQTDPVKPSRCSQAGAFGEAGVPPGLPEYWFNNGARWAGHASEPYMNGNTPICDAPIYVAMHWCTGTPIVLSEVAENTSITTAFDVTNTVTCGQNSIEGPYEKTFGLEHLREGRFVDEARKMEPGNPYEFGPGPWLPMWVTARHKTRLWERDSDPCGLDKVTDSDYATAAAAVAPIDTSELSLPGYLNGPEVPRCGNLQRVSIWEGQNASCGAAIGQLGYSWSTFNQFNGESATEFTTQDGRAGCYVTEPRKFVPKCTAPDSSCNAGWQCVSGQSVPELRRIERPAVRVVTWH